MPSKLQEVTASLSHLNRVEFEAIKSALQKRQAEVAAADTKCHFLKIPAELRNYIYSLIPTTHINVDYLNDERWGLGLLRACKQTRIEFMPIYYNHETFNISLYDHRNFLWIEVKDRRFIKTIMDERMGIRIRYKYKERSWDRDDLKKIMEEEFFIPKHSPRRHVEGILDLGWVWDGCIPVLEVPYTLLDQYYPKDQRKG